MRKLSLLAGILLLLSACGTVTNIDTTTTLDYWKLNGKVKSLEQRMYFAAEKDGVVEKKTMYDNDHFKLNNIYYSFDPDVRANPYLVDVTFTPQGSVASVVFFNVANRATSPERVNATVLYTYNDKNQLVEKRLLDADNKEAIKTTYTYEGGKVFLKKSYNNSDDMEPVELLNTLADEVADEVAICYNEELKYTISNTHKNGICIKSELRTIEGEYITVTESEYDKHSNLTKRTIGAHNIAQGQVKTNTELYTYNKEKQPLTASFSLYTNQEDKIIYTYDDNNPYYTQIDMEREGLTFTYDYEYDEQGNWTRVVRNRIKKNGQSYIMVIERTITYYE